MKQVTGWTILWLYFQLNYRNSKKEGVYGGLTVHYFIIKNMLNLLKKISKIQTTNTIPQHEAKICEHKADKEICFNINDQYS